MGSDRDCGKAHSPASARRQCEKLSPQTAGTLAATVSMSCTLEEPREMELAEVCAGKRKLEIRVQQSRLTGRAHSSSKVRILGFCSFCIGKRERIRCLLFPSRPSNITPALCLRKGQTTYYCSRKFLSSWSLEDFHVLAH